MQEITIGAPIEKRVRSGIRLRDMDFELRHDQQASSYQLLSDQQVISRIDYRDHDGVREMFHTETDPQHRGAGHAARVAQFALRDTAAAGLKVRPSCPFIRDYIDAHPEHHALLVA